MMLLQIYSLDDENIIISTLSEGEHQIGRDKLNCKDKRVSRHHAIITVTKNEVTLKSTHVNPSFYKPCGGNSIKLVKTDETVIINDGDQFGLLADAFWFKTRVVESNNSIKRLYNGIQVEEDNKRVKISNDKDTSNCSISKESVHEEQIESISNETGSTSDKSLDFADVLNKSNENTSNCSIGIENIHEEHNEVMANETADILDKSNLQQNEMLEPNKPLDDKNKQLEEIGINKPDEVNAIINMNEHTYEEIDKNQSAGNEINKPNDDTLNKDDPPVKKAKQKCWYGTKCYRKNMSHKQEYSHPGDSDYDVNGIPDCPFGSTCYRTNMLHRQQYKHINPPAPKPPADPNAGSTSNQNNSDDEDSADDNTTGRKKRKAATILTKYAETPEDDYDLEDPFINDGSSDDFQLSDNDDSESDWQDSQEVDEESQETRRLLKEAKKFTKKKKQK